MVSLRRPSADEAKPDSSQGSGANRPCATLVIGLGNPCRRDDGVGRWVVQQLAPQATSATVLEMSGETTGLLEAWRGAERVLLIDAAESGAAPGTIRRIEVGAGPLPAELSRCSTHALGVAEAIELARALGQLPRQLVIFAVEGADFTFGSGLSDCVAAAARKVLASVKAEIAAARPRRAD
jgi:hydrogenase maturation protease